MSDLLPPNRTVLELALSEAGAFTAVPDAVATLWNPATCPATLLPWLAWALSVEEWDETWDEATQRRVVAASIEIHRRKGTVAAVKKALTSLGHRGQLVEWWQTEPPGTPHTFLAEIEIGNRGIDDIAVAAIERQIVTVKPVRSHFTMRLVGRSEAQARLGCFALSGAEVSIQPYQLAEVAAPACVPKLGIGLHAWGPTSIYPLQ